MRLESSLKLKCERAFMVGVEIHLPNMASSQIIKPPAFKSPSRAPGNNCSARLGGGGGGQIWQLRFQESSSVWAGCIPVYGSRPQRVSYLAQLFNKQKRCMWKVVGTGRLFLPTIILFKKTREFHHYISEKKWSLVKETSTKPNPISCPKNILGHLFNRRFVMLK